MSTVVNIPNESVLPPNAKKSEYAWIECEPHKLKTNHFQTEFTVELEKIDNITIYKFLYAKEWQENINHVWSPMQNTSMMVVKGAAGLLNKAKQGNETFRIDVPLLYETTENKQITLVTNLVYHGGNGGSPKKDVIDPINNLKKWSSPGKNEILGPLIISALIEMPYLFKLKSMDGNGKHLDLINIRAAALTAIQPTYKEPYIQGYPTSADLTLTFTDVEPHLQRSYNYDWTINDK